MIKTKNHVIHRWSGGFDELQQIAQRLGLQGYMFRLDTRNHPESPNQVYPELTVYDNRFRPHVATYNTYIVIGPGHHNIRVIDRLNYLAEFKDAEDE